MLKLTDLSFERNDKVIINNLNFTVNAGQMLQVVGPNGSGKTTLLRLLCGLLLPSVGTVQWHGIDIFKSRTQFLANLLYIGHRSGLKAGLTVQENLRHFCALAHIKTPVSLMSACEQLGLGENINKLAGKLSAGQQRRITLAKLLLLQARLWILDEPFAALDSNSVQWVESQIAAHIAAGGMVILTSHQKTTGLTAETLVLQDNHE